MNSGSLMWRIPAGLAESSRESADGRAWLERLPEVLRQVAARWSLSLTDPFDTDDVTCAWVAPAMRDDGTRAVLKLGMPHMEALHELQGLAFWDGNPTARLLDADVGLNAMLLERCEPGTSLRARPEPEQDRVIGGLLRRLWRKPVPPHPFRPLASMTNGPPMPRASTGISRWCCATLRGTLPRSAVLRQT